MCHVGKNATESSNRIIKRRHQSILESNKQVVSIIIESWSISLEELVGGVIVVVVVIELRLLFACEGRKWEKEASELHVWYIYMLFQARMWKGLSFNSRKHQ